MKQNETPLYTALLAYMQKNIVHFDVPGHKKRFPLCDDNEFWSTIVKYDTNATPDLDVLSNPSGAIAQAEALAAQAFSADIAYMLVNGSTFGVQTMIMTTCGPKDKVLLPRNVHKSAINALILSGAIPVFIQPELDLSYGIAGRLSLQSVKNAIEEHPDVKALFLVNPTYFGMVSDLSAIIKLCHRHRIAVLVDEAHGAHFPFHPAFPTGAMRLGADLSTVSMHKTAGSLTQSSLLLLNEGLVKSDQVRATINLSQTTSASYLLMTSLDLARKRMATQGQAIWGQLLTAIEHAKNTINAIPGIEVLTGDCIDGNGTCHYDESKFVIKVNALGLSGFEVYDLLLRDYNIQVELAETYVVLAIIGVGDDESTLTQLVHALQDISKRFYGKRDAFSVPMADFFEKPPTIIPPRDAFFSPKKVLSVHDAIGEISAESIMIYPPGIPLIIPGERVTKKVLEHYDFYRDQHCAIMNDGENPDLIKVVGE